jgi:ATP-dependent RNA helicase DDX56/DBP9
MADTKSEEVLPEVWSDFKLEGRILEAIRALGWRRPTTVQRACVAHMLKGRDVCVQSRTGSGKTGAFAVPLAQRLFSESQMKKTERPSGPAALILVPSVELCDQTEKVVSSITKYLKPRVVIENLCAQTPVAEGTAARHISLKSGVDIIISTPAALAKSLRAKTMDESIVKGLRLLVIDEADLLISTTSLQIISAMLPAAGLQRVLLSATLTEGVAGMRGHLLRNPTHITLTEDQDIRGAQTPGQSSATLGSAKRGYTDEADDGNDEAANDAVIESRVLVKDAQRNLIRQTYLVATDECHHHTLLYALFRMKLIEGKTLIFVDDEDTMYKLQHFLEQLSIANIVYDTSLPMNVRLNLLRQFQTGEIKTLICTDGTLEKAEQVQLDVSDADKESGLHRGIDFSQIANVIIFGGIDTPSPINFAKYTHRIGRTGRAGAKGLSILFQTVRQQQVVAGALREYVKSRGEHIRPFRDMDRSAAALLQYRVDSALAKVTRNATKRLRVATVAAELARSQYLSTQLNQKDSEAIKKVVLRAKRSVQSEPDLIEVPDYMHMNQVEGVDDFKARVRGGAESKANVFARVAKRRREDPLKQVVAKVRRLEK